MSKNLNTLNIIKGISDDERIETITIIHPDMEAIMPKVQTTCSIFDTHKKHSSIVESNKIRKDFLVKVIIDEDPEIIGIVDNHEE